MRLWQTVSGGALVLGATFLGARPASAQQVVKPDANGFVVVHPSDLATTGGREQILYGDPSKPGPYVIRITWEPGQGSHPHYHDQARLITVLKGTWWVATGPAADTYDPAHMTKVEAGSFIYEPPYGHHYDMAKDQEVVIQISGQGPVKTTQIHE
jgi:quercetin dioxygenase-like cupin family protein